MLQFFVWKLMTLYLVFNANLQQIIMDWKSEEEKVILRIIPGGGFHRISVGKNPYGLES